MNKNDMVISYVFDDNQLVIGGIYKVKYLDKEYEGVLTEISANALTFYVPIKKTDKTCGLEPYYVYATDFYNDNEANIIQLS